MKTRQAEAVSGLSYLSTGEDIGVVTSQAQTVVASGTVSLRLGGSMETSQGQTSLITGTAYDTPEDHSDMVTSQAQTTEAYGTLSVTTSISGTVGTSQTQSLIAEGYIENYEEEYATVETSQGQSVVAVGRLILPEPVVPHKPTGSGVYHGPHGIPVNTDYLNSIRPVTEAEMPYTDFATFFGHNDGGELEKFLEIDQKPKVAEDTTMSFLKSLPAPKFNRSMDFIKSLGAPSPQIIAETEAEITGTPVPVTLPEPVVESVKPKVEPKVIKEKVKPVKKDSFDMLWENTRQTGQMLQQAGKLLEAAVDPKRTEPVNIEDLTKAIAIVEDNIQKLKSKLPIL